MRLNKWVKNQLVAFAIATSNVTNNLTSQKKETLENSHKIVANKDHNNLLNAIKRGHINQEVKDLRWRTYKVLKASQGTKLVEDYTDSEGNTFYKSIKTDYSSILKKVKLDTVDNYELELVVNNDEIALDTVDAMNSEHIVLLDEAKVFINKDGDEVAIHGEIKSDEFDISQKSQRLIRVNRDFIPRFYIEQYAKKINVRKINDEERLLEFYISKYPDELRMNSKLFIFQMNKALTSGNYLPNIFNIKEVEFISYNTLGTSDFLNYKYEIVNLDKLIEFDGNFVIKYRAKVITNGEDILSTYVESNLEKKYNKKEARR